MKKIILFIAVLIMFGLIGISNILSGQFYKLKSEVHSTKSEVTQVEVIQNFWNDALKSKNVEKYITTTPNEYLDNNSRCNVNIDNILQDVNKNKSQSINVFFKDNYDENLKKTALKIGEGQFTLIGIKNYRNWKNEAIVEVTYAKTEEPNIREKLYFFMIKTDNGWKTFLDTPVLTLFNEEYAKFECVQ